MSGASAVVRVLARTIPGPGGTRYREEWLADLEGAAAVGLPSRSVVGGALAVALTIDRADPTITGVTRGRLALFRARWATALLGASAGVVLAMGFFDGYRGLDEGPVLRAAADGVVALALACTAVGLVAAIRSTVVAIPFHAGRPVLVVVLVALLALAWGVVGRWLPPLGTAVLACFFVAALALALRGSSRPHERPPSRRTLVATAIPLSLLVLALTAAGLLHLTVWNPLAKAPGLTLDEIYRAMAAAEQGTGASVIVMWAGVSTFLAVSLVLAATAAPALPWLSSRRISVLGLTIAGGTTFFLWFAGFGMGMSLADTFFTDGGDSAVSGGVIGIAGQLAFAAAIVIGVAPGRRPHPALSPRPHRADRAGGGL